MGIKAQQATTRARAKRVVRVGCWALALAAVALMSLLVARPLTAHAEQSLHARTNPQLAADAAQLDARSTDLGSRLLVADERLSDAQLEQEAALSMLRAWLATAYRDASGDALQQVISAGSLKAAVDRVHLTRSIGRYHASLVRTMTQSKVRVDIGSVERANLINQLTDSQERLSLVRIEQERRANIARERALDVAAARDAKAAKAAAAARPASTPGALTSFAGGGRGAASPVSAAMLDAYLASKGSPMAGHGASFILSGQRWSVDPRLIVAISGAESNFGNILCGPNNAWGWACPNNPEEFATWDAGIETITSGLRRYYLDEGRTSVVLIQQKYAPSGAANDPTGLNNHWVNNVSKFLSELGGNPSMVGPGPVNGPALPDLGGLGLITGD